MGTSASSALTTSSEPPAFAPSLVSSSTSTGTSANSASAFATSCVVLDLDGELGVHYFLCALRFGATSIIILLRVRDSSRADILGIGVLLFCLASTHPGRLFFSFWPAGVEFDVLAGGILGEAGRNDIPPPPAAKRRACRGRSR
nr:uncharacterized protein LOC109751430 [Aegilops tauschii subsp. strangulata]